MKYGKRIGNCTVGECDSPVYNSRGYCQKHYARFLNHGDVLLHYRPAKPKGPCTVPGCQELSFQTNLCRKHYGRKIRLGSPTAAINKHADKAQKSENQVRGIFCVNGHTVTSKAKDCDLLVDGFLKIEVKCAEAQITKRGIVWVFNIHRHGKIVEKSDFYIFQFLGVPGHRGALYAAFKSPLGCYTKRYSLRSMIRELAPHVTLYEILIASKLDITPSVAAEIPASPLLPRSLPLFQESLGGAQ